MALHTETGKTGERLAARWLSEKQYRILHQNWRTASGEIDIIAERKGILHFIEVKTRRSKRFGFPEDHVDKRKLRHMITAAGQYLEKRPWKGRIEFDILSILIDADNPIEYLLIEDVYL